MKHGFLDGKLHSYILSVALGAAWGMAKSKIHEWDHTAEALAKAHWFMASMLDPGDGDEWCIS